MIRTDEEIYKEFGEKLKNLRTERNLTQNEVAKDLGITQASVFKYEKGLRRVPMNMIITFANYFNISVDELIQSDVSKDVKEETVITTSIHNKNHKTFIEYVLEKDPTDQELDNLKSYFDFIISNRGK